MQARWVTNWVLPFFGLMLPNQEKFLTYDEQITMLDAALETASPEKQRSASDYIFILLFEQRQGGIVFLAVAAGAIVGQYVSYRNAGCFPLLYLSSQSGLQPRPLHELNT